MGDAKGIVTVTGDQHQVDPATTAEGNVLEETKSVVSEQDGEKLPLRLNLNSNDTDVICLSAQQLEFKRKKVASTIFTFAAFFGTGLCFGVWGPALLDLKELLNTSYEKITLIFTTRSLGGLLVMFFLAHLFDKFCPYILYMAAIIATIFMTSYAPFTPNLPALLAVTVIFGASLAMVLNGGGTTMIRIWKQKAGPVLQAIYLFFICGSMLAPQITRPFLSQDDDVNFTSSLINHTQFNVTQLSVSYKEIDNQTNHIFKQSVLTAVNEAVYHTKIHLAFIVVACYEFLLLIFAFILWMMESFKVHIETNTDVVINTQKHDSNNCFKYILVFLFASFNFLVVGADLNFGALIMTFSVKYLKWTKTWGTIITTLYYGAQVLGRGIAIPITQFVKPQYYISVNLFLSLASVTVTAFFVNSHDIVIWITCVVYGSTVTGLYPAMLQWLNTFVTVNGTINGLVMAGIPLGFMVFPALSGWLFKTVDPMWFIYTQLIGLVGCVLLLIVIFIYLRTYKYKLKKQNVEIELEEGNELKVDV